MRFLIEFKAEKDGQDDYWAQVVFIFEKIKLSYIFKL